MGLFRKKNKSGIDMKVIAEEVRNYMRIISDSATLVNTTVSPDVFFSRFDLMIETCEKALPLLKQLQKQYNNVDVKTYETQFRQVIKDKQDLIGSFIIRYWKSTQAETEQLKTESAKQRHYQKFYDSLEKYKQKMNFNNINLYHHYYETEKKEGEDC